MSAPPGGSAGAPGAQRPGMFAPSQPGAPPQRGVAPGTQRPMVPNQAGRGMAPMTSAQQQQALAARRSVTFSNTSGNVQGAPSQSQLRTGGAPAPGGRGGAGRGAPRQGTFATRPEQSWTQKPLPSQAHISAQEEQEGPTVLKLLDAVKKTDFAKIKSLLSSKPSLINESFGDNDHTVLHVAVHQGVLKTVELLMQYKADVNKKLKDGSTAAHFAAQRGWDKILATLIKSGADVTSATKDGATPLHIAAVTGQDKTLIELLNHPKTKVNQPTLDGRTALSLAAYQNRLSCVTRLLQKGAKISAHDKDGATPLHFAALKNHSVVMDTLIKAGAKVDSRTNDGRTPLFAAALKGSFEAADILLKHDANPKLDNKEGVHPLQLASHSGFDKIVKLLLDKGAVVDQPDNKGMTPLYFAVGKGHEKCMDLLIKAGAKLDQHDRAGETTLHFASGNGYTKSVKKMLAAGAMVDALTKDGRTPLHSAARDGHHEVVEVLIEAGANVHQQAQDGWTGMHFAAYGGYDKVAQLLLDKKVDVNVPAKNGNLPIHIACEKGKDKVVKQLVEARSDLSTENKNGLRPIHLACINGNPATVQHLLKNGVKATEPDSTEQRPLHYAAANGREKIINLLLEAGASADQGDKLKITPLHAAAASGKKDLVKLFVDRGAKHSCATSDGRTPLHMAVSGGKASSSAHLNTVKTLVELGANVNASDNEACTPLHDAAASGNIGAMKLLLERGANADAQTIRAETALHVAARSGNLEVVELLISHSVDVNKRNAVGETALTIAVWNDFLDVVETLIHHGAKIDLADEEGKSILHSAVELGKTDTVRVLLNAKADPNVTTHGSKDTSLHLAAARGLPDIVAALLSKKASVNAENRQGRTPLHSAALNTQDDVARQLVKAGANVDHRDDEGMTALHVACENDSESLVSTLLNNEADVNIRARDDSTPLIFATRKRNAAIVGQLLSANASVESANLDGHTATWIAAANGDEHILSRLVSSHANVNQPTKDGQTPLHAAVNEGNERAVDILVRAGAQVNAMAVDGKTPLSIAVQRRRFGLVRQLVSAGAHTEKLSAEDKVTLLCLAAQQQSSEQVSESVIIDYIDKAVQSGADVNEPDSRGLTALEYVNQQGEVYRRLLFTYGADLQTIASRKAERSTVSGRSPLHSVVWEGDDPDLYKSELDHQIGGWHVNGRDDEYDRTPLHHAAFKGRIDWSEELINRGANAEAIDFDGRTPIHDAAAGAEPDALEVLLGSVREKAGGNAIIAARSAVNLEDNYGNNAMDLCLNSNNFTCSRCGKSIRSGRRFASRTSDDQICFECYMAGPVWEIVTHPIRLLVRWLVCLRGSTWRQIEEKGNMARKPAKPLYGPSPPPEAHQAKMASFLDKLVGAGSDTPRRRKLTRFVRLLRFMALTLLAGFLTLPITVSTLTQGHSLSSLLSSFAITPFMAGHVKRWWLGVGLGLSLLFVTTFLTPVLQLGGVIAISLLFTLVLALRTYIEKWSWYFTTGRKGPEVNHVRVWNIGNLLEVVIVIIYALQLSVLCVFPRSVSWNSSMHPRSAFGGVLLWSSHFHADFGSASVWALAWMFICGALFARSIILRLPEVRRRFSPDGKYDARPGVVMRPVFTVLTVCVFPSVCLALFRAFLCRRFHGADWLEDTDRGTECWTGGHVMVGWWALTLILTYCVGSVALCSITARQPLSDFQFKPIFRVCLLVGAATLIPIFVASTDYATTPLSLTMAFAAAMNVFIIRGKPCNIAWMNVAWNGAMSCVTWSAGCALLSSGLQDRSSATPTICLYVGWVVIAIAFGIVARITANQHVPQTPVEERKTFSLAVPSTRDIEAGMMAPTARMPSPGAQKSQEPRKADSIKKGEEQELQQRLAELEGKMDAEDALSKEGTPVKLSKFVNLREETAEIAKLKSQALVPTAPLQGHFFKGKLMFQCEYLFSSSDVGFSRQNVTALRKITLYEDGSFVRIDEMSAIPHQLMQVADENTYPYSRWEGVYRVNKSISGENGKQVTRLVFHSRVLEQGFSKGKGQGYRVSVHFRATLSNDFTTLELLSGFPTTGKPQKQKGTKLHLSSDAARFLKARSHYS